MTTRSQPHGAMWPRFYCAQWRQLWRKRW